MGAVGGASAATVAACSLPLRHLLKPHFRPKPYSRYLHSSSLSRCSRLKTLAMTSKLLDEVDVGISCYVSSLPGFRGVLKHRYADFIVHEVDREGNIVRLTSFDLPPEDVEEKEEKAPDTTNKSHADEIESFRSLAGEDDAKMLEQFLDAIANGAQNDPGVILLSPDADKTHRAEVHNFFKRNFKLLVTDTVEESDSLKRIRVRFCPRGGGSGRGGRKRKERGDKGSYDDKPFDSRGSDNWAEHRGKFLRFHLFKENKDSQEALGVIGKMLGIQPRSFGFAGTKDKRSISTQRVTVFKIHAKRLAALNSRLIGIKVGDFSYVQDALVLGQLFGNHFTITLRDVIADSEETVKAAAEGLGRNGFINYFGLQRFGSGSIPTHLIGAALLRGEWRVAASLIIDPRDGERDAVREIREYYKETGDIDGTLRRLPRYLVAERAILQCLKKCPGNYLQALKAIPRTLRMMYVHSYQSYLWNHAASMRVQKHGINQVVLGDLVFHSSSEKLTEAVYAEQSETPDDTYEDTHDSDLNEISDSAVPDEKFHPVKVVCAEDLLEGRYTFDDVVLPLPGSRIIYPENDIAKIYHQLAEKDAISLTESVHGVKEFSIMCMTGGYRRVFQRPQDFAWELLEYTDASTPLAETDFDAIDSTRKSSVHSHEKGCHDQQTNSSGSLEMEGGRDPVPNSDCPSTKLALKLSFTLPASSYATMAIRELLKNSTSVAYQKMLNQSTTQG